MERLEGLWAKVSEGSGPDSAKTIQSLYQAALDSTADGLLLVDLHGRIVGLNQVFLELWRIPPAAAASREDAVLLSHVMDQLADPAGFLTRVQAIYADPGAITFDLVEFKDGRSFERYSRPQIVDGSPVGRVWSFRDATERRRTERRLRQNEGWLRQIIDLMPEAIFAKDADGRFVIANRQAAAAFGTTIEELVGRLDAEIPILQEAYPKRRREDLELLRTGRPLFLPATELIDSEGRSTWTETRKFPMVMPSGERPGVLVVVSDVTQRRLLEAELRQSQKMEAVGRLAGGIAHDFNNLLTAIIGFTANALHGVAGDDQWRQDLVEAGNAARRAADLTRQLLAFSRRQVLRPQVLDLNQVVAEAERLLGRMLGGDVALELELTPSVPTVRADRGQLEQVLLNLVVNAREAMPTGGRLAVSTGVAATIPGAPAAESEQPGQVWARIRVADSGVGISADQLGRIFEPFYTTKESGTGLGLAVVYGIVQQSGGRIVVDSTLGSGTTFDIYLPAVHEPAHEGQEQSGRLAAGPQAGLILVAEDEPAVRTMITRLLRAAGYRVLVAANGEEALSLARGSAETIDLVITDVMMPRLNGRDLAIELRRRRPGLKVIFMSGYPADALDRGVVPDAADPFLAKPFEINELLMVVQGAMAGVRGT